MAKAARKPSTAGAKGGAARVSPASTPSDRAIAMKEEADAARHAAKLAIEDARRVLIDAAANDTAKTINRDESTAGQTWLKLGEAFHKALFDERTGKDRVPMNQQPRIYLTDDGKGPPVKGLEAIAEIHPSIRSKARRMYLLDAEESQVPGEAYRVNEQGERERLNQVPPGLRHPEINIKVGYPTHTIAKYNDALKRFKQEHGWEGEGDKKAETKVDRNVQAALRVRYLTEPEAKTVATTMVRDRLLVRLAEAMAKARLGRVIEKLIDETIVEVRTSMASSTMDEKKAKKVVREFTDEMDKYVEDEASYRKYQIEVAEQEDAKDEGTDQPKTPAPAGADAADEPDPYEVLDVAPSTKLTEITAQYRHLMDGADADRTRALTAAYEAIREMRGAGPLHRNR